MVCGTEMHKLWFLYDLESRNSFLMCQRRRRQNNIEPTPVLIDILYLP